MFDMNEALVAQLLQTASSSPPAGRLAEPLHGSGILADDVPDSKSRDSHHAENVSPEPTHSLDHLANHNVFNSEQLPSRSPDSAIPSLPLAPALALSPSRSLSLSFSESWSLW